MVRASFSACSQARLRNDSRFASPCAKASRRRSVNPIPLSEYDDELEEECEDEGAEHDGCEPDEDGEPLLGWTADGSFINDDDREAGGGHRPPQNRTDLNTMIAVECDYRKFIHGLTGRSEGGGAVADY